jgi:hypothetical protein
VPFPIDDAIRIAVERSFPREHRQRVLAALLAAGYSSRPQIVLLANGDADSVESLVRSDLEDWRHIPSAMLHQFDTREKVLALADRCRELGLPVPERWRDALPETIVAQVKRFVAEHFTRRVEDVHEAIRLQDDLGLVAFPDGPTFVADFAQRFHVDAKSFRPDRHFYERQWDGAPRELARHVLRRRKRSLEPITVADLIAAAQTKRLEISSRSHATDPPAPVG